MKITLRPVIWLKDIDKQGDCPIAISIAGGGKQGYYNTGIKVNPDNYKDGIITKNEDNYDLNNNKLSNLIKDMEREILIRQAQGEPMSVEAVRQLFNPQVIKGGDFYKWAMQAISDKKTNTKRRYEIEVEKIKEYTGERLSFGEITPQWLEAYHRYMLSPKKTEKGIKRGNSSNTTTNAFKVIRLAFNYAREKRATTLYPFTEFKPPKYVNPPKGYLTLEECERINDLLNKDYDSDIKLVAAFFLLEVHSGIRVSDWDKFSIEKMVHENDMIFTTTKTDTPVRLPLDLMPALKNIIDYIRDNNLRFTYTQKHAREVLKIIKNLAGINKHLTTHVARHTFATHSLTIGLTFEEIAIAMGITSKQVSTYAKLTSDKLRLAYKRIGGGV